VTGKKENVGEIMASHVDTLRRYPFWFAVEHPCKEGIDLLGNSYSK
jgi:hypothetical protein